MANSDLEMQRAIYVSIIVGSIVFGAQICLYVQSFVYLLKNPVKKWRNFYILFGAIFVVLTTVGGGTNMQLGQLIWIQHPDYPGGAPAYFADHSSDWYEIWGTASVSFANIMGDGLLLYRCYIIYNSNIWMVGFPFLVLLASTAMIVITIVQSAVPESTHFFGLPINFAIAWICLTVGFNVIVTALICYRLLSFHKVSRETLPSELTNTYTSISAMMLESAAPFTISGIVYVIAFAVKRPSQQVFAGISGHGGNLQALPPQLIITRIAMGMTWNKDMVDRFSDSFRVNTSGTFSSAVASNEGRAQIVVVLTTKESGDNMV
ncbi:uncharacterized protein BT62DRAFT_935046 [Guyanagaster necrorhizus]|uniref:Uncharacterized protein n=1 Tax=Guyanagaster necrorhizus TaxID=856835 RepID=A0A9P7VN77_9AGAR|nr:uncharacterized protein BT62DRAFT_935046 [Guyanagaster necrorhizus MCA 3950]KAG7443430.1 hypothetical protein BT62DRAFT_935046 [Guyanagaster necrorhizus MCA 3950]